MFESLCSWVMIVNGINKYVTEMTEETQDDHIDYVGECTGTEKSNNADDFFSDGYVTI